MGMKNGRGTEKFAKVQEYRWLNTAALVLFLVGVLAGGLSILLVASSRRQLAEENGILVASERLISSMKDLETGYRGFALSGEEPYLEPYHLAERVLPEEMAELHTDPSRRQLLTELIQSKHQFAEETIAARRHGQVERLTEKSIMDSIRGVIAGIQTDAHGKIARVDQRESFWLPILEIVSGVALPLSFLCVSLIALVRRRRERAASALLERVLDHAPIGFGLVDDDLRIRHVNQAFLTMTGGTGPVSASAALWDLLPGLRTRLEP